MTTTEQQDAKQTKKKSPKRKKGNFAIEVWSEETASWTEITKSTHVKDTASAIKMIRDAGRPGRYRVINVTYEGELEVETIKKTRLSHPSSTRGSSEPDSGMPPI